MQRHRGGVFDQAVQLCDTARPGVNATITFFTRQPTVASAALGGLGARSPTLDARTVSLELRSSAHYDCDTGTTHEPGVLTSGRVIGEIKKITERNAVA